MTVLHQDCTSSLSLESVRHESSEVKEEVQTRRTETSEASNNTCQAGEMEKQSFPSSSLSVEEHITLPVHPVTSLVCEGSLPGILFLFVAIGARCLRIKCDIKYSNFCNYCTLFCCPHIARGFDLADSWLPLIWVHRLQIYNTLNIEEDEKQQEQLGADEMAANKPDTAAPSGGQSSARNDKPPTCILQNLEILGFFICCSISFQAKWRFKEWTDLSTLFNCIHLLHLGSLQNLHQGWTSSTFFLKITFVEEFWKFLHSLS